ncbi:MAG: elongation factor P [Chloroflexota bacterium]
MIPASDIRKGTVLRLDGTLYRVMTTQYNNPGRGAASMRAQLMDIASSQTQYRVFSAEDGLDNVYVETEDVKFLYGDDDFLHFMNNETYDQYDVNRALFGGDALYLRDDMDLQLMTTDGSIVIDYELPTTMTYSIVEAEIAVVGNTSGAVTKRVKTDTGLSVTVPNFVNEGDSIKVDTRDGSYVGRA